ncbi:kinesin-like protein klp-20 isoform X2 [Rhinatrema bivittatum]|nr:kinesin-like protein klp-20 isoform X2 [Rhinatrema bivittatum]
MDRKNTDFIINEDSRSLLIRNIADKGFQENVFVFDGIFRLNAGLEKIYSELVQPAIGAVILGYNVTLLVCGSQGSGKDSVLRGSHGQRGLVQQVLQNLFDEIHSAEKDKEWQVTISFVQFYADGTARDLFNSNHRDLEALNVCMLGLVVEGLDEGVVLGAEAAYSLYLQGARRAEEQNSTLFTLTVEQKGRVPQSAGTVQRSVVQVLDLTGETLPSQHGSHISPLMHALQKEITGDAEGFLPIVLQQALEGNSWTVLFYCFNAQSLSRDEILSALLVLDQVRGLAKTISPNCWDPSKLIQKLRGDVRELRTQLLTSSTVQESAVLRLGQLLKQLQVVKNQSWEKKKEISEVLERKWKCWLKAAPGEAEAWHRQGQTSELEAMEREQTEASSPHAEHEEVRAQKHHMLQVFHAYRGLLEEQMDGLEQRYRKLLEEVIQDAVHLAARNQQLEAENKELNAAVAELREKKKM